MKLNAKQIEFIDKFLHRNDVVFVDIKAEMLDHIASAVEEKMELGNSDFHDTFVSYVNSNRKELFKMNRNIWWFSLSEIKNYLSFFLKPICLFVNVFIVIVYFFFRKSEWFILFKENLPFYFLLSFLVIGLMNFVYFSLIKKKRYFFIERSSIVLMILYWINLLMLKPFSKQEIISDFITLFFMCLCTVYFFYTINLINKFLKLTNK